MKYTKKDYKNYLNRLGDEGCLPEESFIIGGKLRRMKYGSALRIYDPIQFEVGFRTEFPDIINEYNKERNDNY